MTDKKDEALKLALQALEYISSHYMSLPKIGCMALAVVEEALAEPAQQQEPVAWMKDCADFWEHYTYISEASQENYKAEAQMWVEKLRKSPQPSKPWVGLTDEDFNSDMFSITSLRVCDIATIKSIAKDVEDKLKERNA